MTLYVMDGVRGIKGICPRQLAELRKGDGAL